MDSQERSLADAFRYDQYAIESQIRLHGLEPFENMILASPRPGEWTLRTEDILSVIEERGEEIALLAFSGVQYYTGQCFDMETITKAAHKKVRPARTFLLFQTPKCILLVRAALSVGTWHTRSETYI